jgi:hypothetical protein
VYAKILFSDDLISYNFLENSVLVFKENTAFVLSEIELFNESRSIKNKNHYRKKTYTVNEYYDDILLHGIIGFPVSPGCALFRTKDLKKSLIVDITNKLNLEFKKFGAGNDLLLFLLTARDYSFISIAPDTKAHFRSHDNSFTIANDLTVYYNYSKYFFTNKYFPHKLSKLKTVFWLRSRNHKKLDEVLDEITVKINLSFLIHLIFKKFIHKLFNRFR